MDVPAFLGGESGSLAAKRVFGEPLERDGTVVIPAAVIRGGGGGGEGKGGPEARAPGEGSGLAFGLTARPAGAFVIRQGHVRWRPAIDVNRIVLGGQVVAAVALIVSGLILRASRRATIRARRFGKWRALRLARGV